jgi:hypothetical protein
MNKKKLLPVLLFLLLFYSCRKDELTLPARVVFAFELIAHEDGAHLKGGPPSNLPGRITVNQGSLTIGSVEFDGRRDEGRDVFFVSDLRQPILVDLENGTSSAPLNFDIPQGIYNIIEIHLDLGGDDMLPLVLEGKINQGTPNEMPIRFEHNIREKFRIKAEPGQGSKVVLRKDTPSNARIIVDSRSIFQFVNPSVIKDASVSVINGENVILINSITNNSIFNKMADRLEKSLSVIID